MIEMKTASLYWITGAVSLGGLLFGFDTGVISGCEEAIQDEFALSPFWHGLVVAGALIGTVFGAVAAGRMCDWLDQYRYRRSQEPLPLAPQHAVDD